MRCGAHNCQTEVREDLWICSGHYWALKDNLRSALLREKQHEKTNKYRYVAVQQRIIGELIFKPYDAEAAKIAAPYFITSEYWRQHAIDAGEGDPIGDVPGLTKNEPMGAKMKDTGLKKLLEIAGGIMSEPSVTDDHEDWMD